MSVWRITQAALNLLMIGLFAALVLSSYHGFVRNGSLRTLGLLAVNLLFLSLLLLRRPARQESEQPLHWLLGIVGTALPLLMRPSAGETTEHLGAAVQVVGFVLLAMALLSLRRSFGIVAANRGVRSSGMYRLVRHPVYLAELVVLSGFTLANTTSTNISILIGEFAVQFARALIEEQLLLGDPEYRSYCDQVRYRLIPGLV